MFVSIFSHSSDWKINKVFSYDKKKPISKAWEIIAVIQIQSYPEASYEGKKKTKKTKNKKTSDALASCWIFFFTPQSSKKEPAITRSPNVRFHDTLVLVMTTTETGAKIQLPSLMCLQNMWAHEYKQAIAQVHGSKLVSSALYYLFTYKYYL